jgi:hypothetical protein
MARAGVGGHVDSDLGLGGVQRAGNSGQGPTPQRDGCRDDAEEPDGRRSALVDPHAAFWPRNVREVRERRKNLLRIAA